MLKDTEKLLFPLEDQVNILKSGARFANVIRPAKVGDGILALSEKEVHEYHILYLESSCSVAKFIPASGAASRMFKHIHNLSDESSVLAREFLENIKNFAFSEKLEEVCLKLRNQNVKETIDKGEFDVLSHLILNEEGLGYGEIPKGLVPFHKYYEKIRTPFEEHITEGLEYAVKNSTLNLHFTVSPNHLANIKSHIQTLANSPKEVQVIAEYSIQDERTNTVSLDDNDSVILNDGKLYTRPGGHGALIHNLNKLKQDIIFIKNIDNVVLESSLNLQSKWKRALAGKLVSVRSELFSICRSIECKEIQIKEAIDKVQDVLGVELTGKSLDGIMTFVNRPIRVCGMVPNSGEPGGGPFWVNSDFGESLQIVESAELDMSNKDHLGAISEATHFNPVDLVCSITDFRGEKFNLMDFVDANACFTSNKNYKGREIKVLELPGLWNGAMAKWISIFVEVPAETFNPVKTVNDLLKKSHREAL